MIFLSMTHERYARFINLKPFAPLILLINFLSRGCVFTTARPQPKVLSCDVHLNEGTVSFAELRTYLQRR